ncbi:MAG TPA: glycosyltransferase family 1 protein, partial [Candidatus Moranbacteria bacterium]|nr:glycosyltransferase family 1 protein [Candidatus Moranbacteria bacterium]
LAFKYFPDCFPKKDLFELNTLLKLAVNKSDKIIAVSNSTKLDILKFYPKIKEDKVKVIYHGFDTKLFQKEIPQEKVSKVLASYKLPVSPASGQATSYILYVGAIQPRKNLETLVEAFDLYKKNNPAIKLVLAGGKAWQWEGTMEKIENSPYKNDIIVTGTIGFDDMVVLYRNAALFVFPSLYEGFGIPILEAFVSEVPVICANNSSLPEVGGDAVKYFDSSNHQDLYKKIKEVLENDELKNILITKGKEQLQKFSWEKCAKETLDWIKS